jgi:cytochrome c peroxidase
MKHFVKHAALTRQPIFSSMLLLMIVVMPLVLLTADGRGDDSQGSVEYLKQYARPKSIMYPAENGYSAERELLGKTLFFDPRLSGSNWISCATCHNPALSWGDGLPKAIGHGMQVLGRRTPTILNLAWSPALFWDGRAASLEEQALGPIAAPGEMNMPLEQMVGKIRALPGYRSMFDKAYPNETIDEKTIAKAIANFERTIVSGKAPFDRWVEGDASAMSTEAKRGFALFNGKANCAKCHSGWRFTDDSFHDIGIAGSDPGRGKLFQTVVAMQHGFKTPSLRNVERRAPYMHDGSEASLEEVVELYAAGGRVKRPSLSAEIRPLNLTDQDKRDLVAFLKTLTSADRSVEIPTLPR